MGPLAPDASASGDLDAGVPDAGDDTSGDDAATDAGAEPYLGQLHVGDTAFRWRILLNSEAAARNVVEQLPRASSEYQALRKGKLVVLEYRTHGASEVLDASD